MSERDEIVLVQDILQAVNRIDAYSAGLTFDQFLRDGRTQDAVVRNLEIIGEAAKKFSLEFHEANRSVPWPEICGMRDRLIHDYFGIDWAIVWDVIKTDLPELRRQLQTGSPSE